MLASHVNIYISIFFFCLLTKNLMLSIKNWCVDQISYYRRCNEDINRKIFIKGFVVLNYGCGCDYAMNYDLQLNSSKCDRNSDFYCINATKTVNIWYTELKLYYYFLWWRF
jgi:hypothetical protein